MREYGAEAGIPETLRHAHVLRHTCGRLAFKAGMSIPDIQKYLAHVKGANPLTYMQSDEREACKAFAVAMGAMA